MRFIQFSHYKPNLDQKPICKGLNNAPNEFIASNVDPPISSIPDDRHNIYGT